MDDDGATLSVGFTIDFGNAFGEMKTLDDLVGTTAANVYREFKKIEQASGSAVKLAGSTAEITSFGNAVNREMRQIKLATDQAERSGEAMVRQLEREARYFGLTRSEVRSMNAELRATEADSRGLTELAGRIRGAEIEMKRLEATSRGVAGPMRQNAFAVRQFAMQMPDVIQGLLTGQKPMQVFIQQGSQIAQTAQMAEGGVMGFSRAIGAAALPFAPFIAAAALAVGGFALFTRAIADGVDTSKIIADLGMTKDEIGRLQNVSVTTGDVVKATFQVMAESIGIDLGKTKKWFGDALDWMTVTGRQYLASLYTQFVGTFKAIGVVVRDVFSGKGVGEIVADVKNTYIETFNSANDAMTAAGKRITDRIASNKRADYEKQRDAMREADAARKAATGGADRHAMSLARENDGIEKQIRNLYGLADAYRVSAASALIEEARGKAKGTATPLVDQQIRLAVAQRVADIEKANAAMNDQARIQTEVNALVANGNVTVERANQIMQDRIADLPLLAAIEAAQQRGLAKEAAAATKALEEQHAAQQRRDDSERGGRFNALDLAADARIAELQAEIRLIGASDEVRNRELATIKAVNEAKRQGFTGQHFDTTVGKQIQIDAMTNDLATKQGAYNDALAFTVDRWDIIAGKVQTAGQGMADAFGDAGRAIGDMASIYATFTASRKRAEAEHRAAIERARGPEAVARENARFALRSSGAQIQAYGDMALAAKGFFAEGSKGYSALAAAEKVYRVAQFAMSIQAMVQNAAETLGFVTNAAARATAEGTAGIASQSKLPFPANIAAMAATAAALVAAGVAVFGGRGGGTSVPLANSGTGTVLGDRSAQSESLKRSIDALKDVDTLMLSSSRQMAASLRSIDSQIGGLATVLIRSGNIDANSQVATGFKSNALGSVLGAIPLIGGFLGGLFGTKTSVLASGIYSDKQSVGDILGGGFDARTYSDIEKTKKFLGITTSKKVSTVYGSDVDARVGDQFTLILRSFNDAIVAAAGPLGASTSDIASRVASFVVDLGKVDLSGLTGTEIQDKLSAVFGAAADRMADSAFPGIERFQKVGEGAFETLVRVSSTVEAVTASLDQLGGAARSMGVDAKIGLANQFDSVSDLTGAIGTYFETFYSKEEQAAAKSAQLSGVFGSLGLAMPATLTAFRQLVDVQDLTTASGQSTYATLLKLSPAFADLKASMEGAKSAADIASERQDLERQLLELRGDTAALRALEIGKLDASNRALQEQIFAIQDAQEAAKAADELRQAWVSVGDGIKAEIDRIRGLSGSSAGGSFAQLLARFNAANMSARAGDQDVAKTLPQLSQSLLTAAGNAATSRQELDRVTAQTAAQLEATYSAIKAMSVSPVATDAQLLAASAATQAATAPSQAMNDNIADQLRQLNERVDAMHRDNNTGHANSARESGRAGRVLEAARDEGGSNAIAVTGAAA